MKPHKINWQKMFSSVFYKKSPEERGKINAQKLKDAIALEKELFQKKEKKP